MITAVRIVSENEVIVKYDNRPDLIITTDNGSAAHLMEGLLSPRWDMSYSEYLELMSHQDEKTQEIAA